MRLFLCETSAYGTACKLLISQVGRLGGGGGESGYSCLSCLL